MLAPRLHGLELREPEQRRLRRYTRPAALGRWQVAEL
ncbi:hypothetical protein NPIL_33241, partial [Nephila pilipes]